MRKKLTDLHQKLSDNSAIISVFALLFIAYLVLMPKTGHGGDFWCWGEWTKYIFNHGLKNVYKSNTDYLPLYHYILFFFGKLQGSIVYIDRNIYYLKIITLLFDFIAGFFLIKYLNNRFDKNQSIFYSFFFFFNIAYFYNTIIWGQVDGIMACFVFLAFYYALKQKVWVSLIFIVLSINFKLQAIIFMPILGLLLLPSMVEQFSFRKLFQWVAIPLVLQFAILLPFLIAGDVEKIWNVVKGSSGKYPVVSMNAYNFWFWVIRGNLMEVQDNIRFFGVTYKNWGLLIFSGTSFLALYPLIKNVFAQLFRKEKPLLDNGKILIIFTLIPILFFFFNTQMHERYLHPALLFLAVYSIISKKHFPYILCSIAYFLNLEGVLQYLQLKNYGTVLFHPCFIAFLFFVCIIYLFMQLYEVKVFSQRKSNKTVVV